jgi:hypothetical protein
MNQVSSSRRWPNRLADELRLHLAHLCSQWPGDRTPMMNSSAGLSAPQEGALF